MGPNIGPRFSHRAFLAMQLYHIGYNGGGRGGGGEGLLEGEGGSRD